MDNLEGGTEVSSRHLAGLLLRKGVEVEEWAPFNRRKPMFWYTSIFGQIYILIVLAWKLVKNRVQILHVQGKYLLPPVIILGKLLKIPTVATIRDYVVVCPIGLCLFDFHKGFKKGLSLPMQGESLKYTKHGFIFFFTREVPSFLSIYHRHDNLIIRMIRYTFLIRGWVVMLWLRWWLKRADAVVSVSKYVQSVLGEYEIKSEVIYNAFNPVFASESNKVRPCRGKVGPLNTKARPLNTILFVGKPSYGKGHDLFRSLSRNKVFRDFRFVTIGGDKKLPYLETLRKIKDATAVVVPSRWPEPFGRVALESLIMGTPVLATKRGGLPEIVENGVTGILTNPTAEAMTNALRLIIKQNKKFRDKIKIGKKLLTKKFGSTPLKSYVNLYSSFLAKISSG